MNIEDLPDDSETSDEDYVPEGSNANLPSEEESDGEPEDDLSFQDGAGKRGKKQPKGSRKKKRKNKTKENLAEEPPAEIAEPEISKAESDSLWADFMKDTGFKSKSDRSQVSVSTASVIEKPNESKVESETEKVKSPKTVKVTEIFNFAGEEVKVEKEVKVDEIKNDGSPSGSLLAKKPARGGGLNSILSQLGNKTRKISTLEKTKLDWDKFKKDEKIEDELQAYGKSKDGYLERQDFLQRADLRRFEIEKDIRSNLRSNRTNNV